MLRRMGHAQNVREDLEAELEQDRPDPDAVGEIHDRMAEIHGEMLVDRVRMRNAIYGLLTDEKREQLASGVPETGDASTDSEAVAVTNLKGKLLHFNPD